MCARFFRFRRRWHARAVNTKKMVRFIFIVNQTTLVGAAWTASLTARLQGKFGAENVAQISLFDPLRPLLEPFVDHPQRLDSVCHFDDTASNDTLRAECRDAEQQYATQRITLAEGLLFGQQRLLGLLALRRIRSAELLFKDIIVVGDIRFKEDLMLLKGRHFRCVCVLLTNAPESAIATDSLTTSMFETTPKHFKNAEIRGLFHVSSKVSATVNEHDYQHIASILASHDTVPPTTTTTTTTTTNTT
jgi:hypothetical protein